MKKIILSILSAVAITLSAIVLAYACNFLIEIKNTPELLILEEVEVFPGSIYVVQTELVTRWESYCAAIIVLTCAAIVTSITALCFVNFFKHKSPADKVSRTEARKVKKIAKLEKELEDLKKNGE